MGRYNRRRKRKSSGEEFFGLLLIPGFLWYAKLHLHLAFSWTFIFAITLLILVFVIFGLVTLGPRHKRLEPNQMDTMTGEQFERLLQQYLRKAGWKLRTTPKTGDFGADLIGRSPWGETYVIQAKRWKNKVGVPAVQQAHAAQAHYHTQKALVITNSWLTRPAREHAQAIGVEVWERPKLERELSKVQVRGQKHDSNSI